MATSSVGTGFLYGNGTDEMSGQTPICCTPEYLAAFGIGLDSTYGDGQVKGVLREDQAEQQFKAMYADEYTGAAQLQAITKELTGFVTGLEGDNVDVDQLFKKAQAAMKGETPAEGEAADPNVAKLVTILTKIETAVAPMEKMLTNFFGKDVVKAAAGGDENEGPRGLALLMAQTVVSSYDTGNGEVNDDDEANNEDSNNVNAVLQKGEMKAEGVITVSLGEIFQWALETNVFMDVYNKAGGGQTVTDFANKAYTAMSEGDTATFNAIAKTAGVSPEQLQVILSSMMNNHSNLMATKGTFGTSTKNGAHQFLNNIQDSQMIQAGGGANNDQAFQLLHVGNMGATGTGANNEGPNQNGNDNLNETRDSIKSGNAKAIFTAGDNGNNNNGNIEDALNKEGFGDSFKGDTDYTTTAAKAPEPIFEGAKGEGLKSELLADLSARGWGSSTGMPTTADESGQTVDIDGQPFKVAVTDSEDFENEGYDVVIITVTNAAGQVVGSFTATEDGKTNRLVEFADNDGDGHADAVDPSGLSTKAFKKDGLAVGDYASTDENGENGRGNLEVPEGYKEGEDFLAQNEDVTVENGIVGEGKRFTATGTMTGNAGDSGRITGWAKQAITGGTGAAGAGDVVLPTYYSGEEFLEMLADAENPPTIEPTDTIMSYTVGTGTAAKTYFYSFTTGETYDITGEPVTGDDIFKRPEIEEDPA